MTIEERRSTAIHEAGHVIVAWTLGLPVGAMEIGINGDDAAANRKLPTLRYPFPWLTVLPCAQLGSGRKDCSVARLGTNMRDGAMQLRWLKS